MGKIQIFKTKKRDNTKKLKYSNSSRIPIKVHNKTHKKLVSPIKLLPKLETRVEVSIRKKIAGQAPEEYHFVLADGRKLRDMLELVEGLEHMSDDIYRHHVNETRNDFSTWLRDVFNEDELADEIAKINNKVDTQTAVMKHLLKKIVD